MEFGVYALYDLLKEKLSAKVVLPIVTVACLLAAPVILAAQNWDDHDRSNRKKILLGRNHAHAVQKHA